MTSTTNAPRPAILSLGWDINSRTLRLWVYLPPDAVANPNYALLGNCLTIRSAWGWQLLKGTGAKLDRGTCCCRRGAQGGCS